MTTRVYRLSVTEPLKSAGSQQFTHEEIVCFRKETSNLKQFHQIEKLSKRKTDEFCTSFRKVTAHRNWGVYDLTVAFLDQDFASLYTQPFNLFF
jgi:hypothetical protein